VSPTLRDLIAVEIDRPVSPAVASFAERIAKRHGVCSVLFYGSALRTGDLDGVLDFYVLVDSLRAWHGKAAASLANRLVPPTVEFWQHDHEGQALRAKVAVLAGDQFLQLNNHRSIDTTIWARFAQPVALLWARDPAARAVVVEALVQAVVTAGRWAAVFGPAHGAAEDFWRALFRQTFSAELRVEKRDRADEIVGFARDRYRKLLPLAWSEASLAFRQNEHDELFPEPVKKDGALRAWRLRRALGKPLNILRLAKASFSFEGGVDYILWKIERHTNVRVALTPWQRRHPILASPALLWRLWRDGVVR
jgi:hypothetical protein